MADRKWFAMNIHWLTFVGLFLILIGTVLTMLGQQKISEKDSKLLQVKSDKIESLSQNINTLNQENAELNKKIAATITGGDSYCYLMVRSPRGKQNLCDLMLVTKGEYPLYDVSITIEDAKRLVEMVHKDKDAGLLPYETMTDTAKRLDEARHQIDVGNIKPNTVRPLGGIKAPKADVIMYNIYITARNGSVMQIVRFHRIDGNWKRARKLVVNDKVIEEYIDPDFPLGADGKVKW